MRSLRKGRHSKEVRFWADEDLHKRLTDICMVMPQNMGDLVEELVRNQLPVVERNVWGRYERPR